MSCETILAELDKEQRLAATAETNAVVAAGAGSGKTKVLAARYAWLVMEKKIPVDEILTLTFTNKAVNEMYSRIYGLLAAERENPEARRAVEEFHRANISTLDAFCGQIARTAARRYGVSPGFASDDQGVRDLAMEASLPFVLEHRDNPSLQMLLSSKKIKTVAEELFAETVLRHSPVSKPLDFSRFIAIQHDELLRQWKKKTAEASDIVNAIKAGLENSSKKSGALYDTLQKFFSRKIISPPEIAPLLDSGGGENGEGKNADEMLRRECTAYFEFLNELKSTSLVGKTSEELIIIKEKIKELREPLYGELESIANMALQSSVAAAVFPLVEEFQNQFNRKKREAGILTFNDIAHLAVDALTDYPDIRQVYKDSYAAIMIDEFQDNNSLQRDLIFLLAGKPERRDQGIPAPEELAENKMFFVGDEKQSIYRFRGADVSVFRSLAQDLGGGEEGSLSLIHNYRSRPVLIEAFNRIFGGAASGGTEAGAEKKPGVFLESGPDLPGFEAVYSRLYPREEGGSENPAGGSVKDPQVHFCFLDKGSLNKEDPQALDYDEIEAAFIAAKIREMVDSGYAVEVREKGKRTERPCTYSDFAVLQRSYSRQGILEKQCKLFGIPFNADRPAGLFSDAPINDLYHLLRLIAYPGDRLSYAALLRSPFVRLSDEVLSICLLDDTDEDTGRKRPPFDEKLDEKIPPEELEQYREGRRRFQALLEEGRSLDITALLTKLWFGEGYRYETLWSAPAQIYGELFDLFFEIARKTGEAGKSLSDFIDYLSALMSMEERADDMDIPPEGETGVRLMSIHKSKGLEFPVVFIYGCGNKGANQRNSETVFFSQEWGITLNLPPADELPGSSGNFFFNVQKELEKARAEAELRRLLYVAMTRAESALFITASLPEQTKTEREGCDPGSSVSPEDFIKTRIGQLAEKEKNSIQSFLDLLLPVIAACENPPFSVEAIPVVSRRDLRRMAAEQETPLSMEEAAERAVPFYDKAGTVPPPPPAVTAVHASSLRIHGAGDFLWEDTEQHSGLDKLLEQSGLSAADFGTIAHSFIEDRFHKRPYRIPPRLEAKIDEARRPGVIAEAESMAGKFFASELGRISLAADYQETEFPIITIVEKDGKKIPVSGQIDLLFESGGTMYVTDFKTDRRENPVVHIAQLAVYARAVSDIFGKPVRSWLFYLRGGHAVEVSNSIKTTPIEDLL